MKSLSFIVSKLILASTTVSLLFAFSGCSTSYVQKSPEWNPTSPQKTLLAHFKLKKIDEVSLLDVVKVLVTDENPFQKIGILTLSVLKSALKEKNIDLYADSKRAKKLNEMRLLDLDETTGKTVSNLMDLGKGEWVHPETSNLRFDARVVVLGEFYNDIAKTIDLKDDELALSATVSVKADSVLAFLGEKLQLNLITRIINSSGESLYESNTNGESSTVWLFSGDWLTEENIMDAMSIAVNEMLTLEVEELSFFK